MKYHSKGIFLIYIPCEVTRNWALDVGFWQSGNCSFTVSLWSQSLIFAPMKLVYAPIWVLFKNVPPELWSLLGFSTIASDVGFPVHSEFLKLNPYYNGIVKLKVVVELAKPRSSSVRIADKDGNSVLISAEYPKLPPQCGLCGNFGHLELRCLESAVSPTTIGPQKLSSTVPVAVVFQKTIPIISPLEVVLVPSIESASHVSLFKSLPASPKTGNNVSNSGGWKRVVTRSKPPTKAVHFTTSVHPVSSSQFDNKEEIIQATQKIIQRRIENLETPAPSFVLATTRRKARKRRSIDFCFCLPLHLHQIHFVPPPPLSLL